MGVKPAQSELNAPLRSIFGYIPHFFIHNDLITVTKTASQHKDTLMKVSKFKSYFVYFG